MWARSDVRLDGVSRRGRRKRRKLSQAGGDRCLHVDPRTTGDNDMSDTRVPKAEITGLYGYALKRFSRKLLGDIPEPAEVMWHNRPVLKAMSSLGQKAQKWDQLDPNLK